MYSKLVGTYLLFLPFRAGLEVPGAPNPSTMLLYHSFIPLIVTILTITIPLTLSAHTLGFICCIVSHIDTSFITPFFLDFHDVLTTCSMTDTMVPIIRHKQTYIPSLSILQGLARLFSTQFLSHYLTLHLGIEQGNLTGEFNR